MNLKVLRQVTSKESLEFRSFRLLHARNLKMEVWALQLPLSCQDIAFCVRGSHAREIHGKAWKNIRHMVPLLRTTQVFGLYDVISKSYGMSIASEHRKVPWTWFRMDPHNRGRWRSDGVGKEFIKGMKTCGRSLACYKGVQMTSGEFKVGVGISLSRTSALGQGEASTLTSRENRWRWRASLFWQPFGEIYTRGFYQGTLEP